MKPIVLDVGQCDYDHGRIRAFLERMGCEVKRAHSAAEARAIIAAGAVSLVLVNRILDTDGADGVALIGELVKEGGNLSSTLKVMLVSNYPEYQDKAVTLGALYGFGKSELEQSGTAEKISKALGK
jgi:DNA-binding response OmpR family regulator